MPPIIPKSPPIKARITKDERPELGQAAEWAAFEGGSEVVWCKLHCSPGTGHLYDPPMGDGFRKLFFNVQIRKLTAFFGMLDLLVGAPELFLKQCHFRLEWK